MVTPMFNDPKSIKEIEITKKAPDPDGFSSEFFHNFKKNNLSKLLQKLQKRNTCV